MTVAAVVVMAFVMMVAAIATVMKMPV